MYTAFASVYDQLMRDVPYAEWAAFYRGILNGMGIADNSAVVECACGTGNLTIPLAKYFQMTGVDNAQDMLSLAADKARRQGHSIRFVNQDMRQLAVHKPVDAVLCTCDGVNYLTGEDDAPLFFAAAFRALRPGGAFVFDVSTLHKLKHTLGTGVRTQVDEDTSYIWHSRWSEAEQVSRMDLTVFALRPDGTYDRVDEHQTQRAYGQDELSRLLNASGFADIAFYGDVHHNPPQDNEPRLHVAARRPTHKGER